MNLTLQSLFNQDLIYKVIDKFFNGYIQFMEIDSQQRIKLQQYIQAPATISYTDVAEFTQIYSTQFKQMVFPKTTLLTFLGTAKQCTEKLNEMGVK